MPEVCELPVLPRTVRTLTNVESERLHRIYPKAKRAPEDCITCKGRGTFRWWKHGARDEVVEFKCSCVDQWVLSRFFLNSGIGINYQRLDWLDVGGVPEAVWERVLRYIDHADGFIDAGCGLLFYGDKGTGKTMLAALVLKRLMVEEGVDGYLTTFAEMLAALMAGFDDPTERQWFVARIRNAGLLVIDDVGREHHQRTKEKDEKGDWAEKDKTTATAESLMDDIIRHRIASSLPTIITTNLDPETIDAKYGRGQGNIISLLSERSIIIPFEGESYRRRVGDRIEDEVMGGLTRPVVWK